MSAAKYLQYKVMGKSQGFSLIELMVAMFIVAALAAVAVPTYQEYSRKSDAALAQQEILRLAEQLERHKGRNFSYKGFDAEYLYKDSGGATSTNVSAQNQTIQLPLNAATARVKYTISIKDITTSNPMLTESTSIGRGWSIKAESSNAKNYSFLMNSNGMRCKNKTKANIDYASCGSQANGSESW